MKEERGKGGGRKWRKGEGREEKGDEGGNGEKWREEKGGREGGYKRKGENRLKILQSTHSV